MPRLVATALTGAVLALPPLAPVPAAAAGEAPRATLLLSLSTPDGGQSGSRFVTLRCGPTGGTHPRAEAACAELRRSGGVIEHAPQPGAACTMIYAPVLAKARGRWQGRPIRFRTEYPNRCVMISRTGSVFRF